MEQSLEAGQPLNKEQLLQLTQALYLLVQELPSDLTMEQYESLWQKIQGARFEVLTLIYSSGQNSKPSETDEKS